MKFKNHYSWPLSLRAASRIRGTQVHGDTKQHHTYLPYTFPAVAGTHLPTMKGWRVE